MPRRLLLISLMGVVFLLTGCALTVDRIPLNYKMSQEFCIALRKTDKKLVVQNIEDVRSISNPKYILQKRNGYGQLTCGAFEAEREISLIITDELKKVLTNNGYNLSESEGNYIIKGKLISIDGDYETGLWTGSLKLKMQIDLSLVDATNQETVWKEMFVINGASRRTVSTTIAIQSAFKETLDNFLQQFVKSDFVNKIK